jgi:hypothetical protein
MPIPQTSKHGSQAMNELLEVALAHPVFDPETQIGPRFFWRDKHVSVGVTST